MNLNYTNYYMDITEKGYHLIEALIIFNNP